MNDQQREQLIQSVKEHKYERSRHLMDFHIAGFAYYDGLDVIEELTLGKHVELVPESDNPYDPEAVVIFYDGKKIGYVPKDKNALLSKLLYFGHANIFDARIQYINKETHPERQFRVVVKIADNR
ncbi:HIRAN domain-containing protein [Amphibacillus indicireducens]|uniref:HIRAN domain-containing protein n=1 Tax=Amphibacillus indicireducens TaxID=1076330 RepID=A0ABP7V4S9_9BACI